MDTKTKFVANCLLVICILLFAGMVIAQQVHEANNPAPEINLIATRCLAPRSEIGFPVAREVVMTLPEDCKTVLSGTNNKNGVVVCYESTKGGTRMIQYSGIDYKDVTIFYLVKRQK